MRPLAQVLQPGGGVHTNVVQYSQINAEAGDAEHEGYRESRPPACRDGIGPDDAIENRLAQANATGEDVRRHNRGTSDGADAVAKPCQAV